MNEPIPRWIDIHSHIERLDLTPSDALREAESAGVAWTITIGTEPKDHDEVVRLAREFPGKVFATLGVHPHEATLFDEGVGERMRSLAQAESGVVAIGEIGLDYYYNQSPREVQIEAFEMQLEIAAALDLPVEIHTRDAEADTRTILDRYRGRVRGVLHCFTGTRELAFAALDAGFDISISGVVTFKNAQDLRETVQALPSDRLHVETDAPFLAPVPLRGKKNRPAFLPHTARVVADLRGESLTQLSHQTRANARSLFRRLAAAASLE